MSVFVTQVSHMSISCVGYIQGKPGKTTSLSVDYIILKVAGLS